MQPTAQKSSQSRPPVCRVLAASCSRPSAGGDTLLRLHLDAGAVMDFVFSAALADLLGLQPAILGAPVGHKGVATGQGKGARPNRVAEYRAAWLRYLADRSLGQQALADELGCSQTTLSQYFRRFAAEPGAPLVKPSGKLT